MSGGGKSDANRRVSVNSLTQIYRQIVTNKLAFLILTVVLLYTVVLLSYSTLTIYDDPASFKNKCQSVAEDDAQVVFFDLDDTLYWSPALRQQLKENVYQYLVTRLKIQQPQAKNISNNLYKKYGTTLAALVALGYNVNITDFHNEVFRISYAQHLQIDQSVLEVVRQIVQPKFIFTNGNHFHTDRVLSHLGFSLRDFDGIISFDTLMGEFVKKDGYLNRDATTHIVCKPLQQAYEKSLQLVGQYLGGAKICPQQVVFVDDSDRNIQAANQANLKTVLITHGEKTTLRPTNSRKIVTKLDQLLEKATFLFQA